MKIIFLDIDGVLNSTTDFLEAKFFEKSINYKSEVISPGKLQWLEEIIKQTDAKIVITSAWREMFSLKELYDMFVERGFSLPVTAIIGKTNKAETRLSDYGEEYRRSHLISDWLDEKDNIESYVIIDDIPAKCFEECHQDNLVTTTMDDGLNHTLTNKAIDILGRNEEYQKKYEEYQKSMNMLVNCMV